MSAAEMRSEPQEQVAERDSAVPAQAAEKGETPDITVTNNETAE